MGRTVPGCGGEIAGYLISPRRFKGIFGNGHQLDVGVSHFFDIGDKLFRHPGIAEILSVVVLAPTAHVHLIDIHGGFQRMFCLFPFPIGIVGPLEAADVVDLSGSAGTGFHVITIGVALIVDVSVRTLDIVFISVINCNTRDKAFPAASITETAHFRSRVIIPVVKITYDPNALGVRRPDTEDVTFLSVLSPGVGPKEIIGTIVFSTVENVQGKILILGCCLGRLGHCFSCCIF